MMYKQDYELIAECLKDSKPNHPKDIEVWENICENLAYDLSRANTRFDRNKFLTACGIED